MTKNYNNDQTDRSSTLVVINDNKTTNRYDTVSPENTRQDKYRTLPHFKIINNEIINNKIYHIKPRKYKYKRSET